MCFAGNPACIGEKVVKAVGNGAVENVASAVSDAVGEILKAVGTAWVKVPTPNLASAGGGPSATVAFLQQSVWWFVGAFAVIGIFVGVARMVWEMRAEPGFEILKSLFRLSVVTGCGLATIGLATTGADEFSKWIIDQSVSGSDFGTNVVKLIGLSSVTGTQIAPFLTIVIGFFALLASIVQIALMWLRGVVLVLLAGALPLMAAGTMTEMGRQWFKHGVAWIAAFILYKPAAAFVYAAAFRLMGTELKSVDAVSAVIGGVMLMMLAIFALPALMRVAVPVVSAVSSGGGAMGAVAGGAAVAAIPTGAVGMSSKMSGGSGGGASPAHAGESGQSATGATGVGGSSGPKGSGSPGSSGAGGGAGSPGSAAASAASPGAAAPMAAGAAAGGPAGAVLAAASAAKQGVQGVQGAADSATGSGNSSGASEETKERGPDGSR